MSKKERLAELNHNIEAYKLLSEQALQETVVLFEKKQYIQAVFYPKLSSILEQLQYMPDDLTQTLFTLKQKTESFKQQCDLGLKAYQKNVDSVSFNKEAMAASAGVAAGMVTGLAGPTAAMAVATTFGTASTGVAISALSGQAAINAALAWLGGGTIAAGGGGVVAGESLLALLGPIGWTIGGVTLATVGLTSWYKHNQAMKDINNALHDVHKMTRETKATLSKLRMLVQYMNQILQRSDEALIQLAQMMESTLDYSAFTLSQKEFVFHLTENIKRLSIMMGLDNMEKIKTFLAEYTV